MRSAFQRGNIVFWLLGYMNMPMVCCQIKGYGVLRNLYLLCVRKGFKG